MKKLIARWDWMKVREYCIRYNYCTEMDSEQYEELLTKVRNNNRPTNEDIMFVIADIWDYSDTAIEAESAKYGVLEDELFDHMVFTFMDEVVWHTVER